jgi:hypothetical protein
MDKHQIEGINKIFPWMVFVKHLLGKKKHGELWGLSRERWETGTKRGKSPWLSDLVHQHVLLH